MRSICALLSRSPVGRLHHAPPSQSRAGLASRQSLNQSFQFDSRLDRGTNTACRRNCSLRNSTHIRSKIRSSQPRSSNLASHFVTARWLLNFRLAHSRSLFTSGDLSDVEADIKNDDPTINSTPQKITASKADRSQIFLHASWSEMSLASELSGSNALVRIQTRVSAYWDRQYEKRLNALRIAKETDRLTMPASHR